VKGRGKAETKTANSDELRKKADSSISILQRRMAGREAGKKAD
jgi:hypothetical protein